jgi:hypothetical protein
VETRLVIYKFEDVYEKIIPFFKKYSLLGVKLINFTDFCEVAELVKNKTHLTESGYKQIVILKSGMNKGRK